jgi:hypothetical protein
MTRFFYFILPLAAMLAFAGYYYGVFYKEQVRMEEEAKRKADEEAKAAREKKAADEAKATADAKARAEQKRKEEQDKRDERDRRQAEEDEALRVRTVDAETRATKLSKTRADYEIQLAELRRSREGEQRKAFDLRREVEQMKITRRNAELAIQLDTEKIASRVEASSMVQEPIFVRPPAAEGAPAPAR